MSSIILQVARSRLCFKKQLLGLLMLWRRHSLKEYLASRGNDAFSPFSSFEILRAGYWVTVESAHHNSSCPEFPDVQEILPGKEGSCLEWRRSREYCKTCQEFYQGSQMTVGSQKGWTDIGTCLEKSILLVVRWWLEAFRNTECNRIQLLPGRIYPFSLLYVQSVGVIEGIHSLINQCVLTQNSIDRKCSGQFY